MVLYCLLLLFDASCDHLGRLNVLPFLYRIVSVYKNELILLFVHLMHVIIIVIMTWFLALGGIKCFQKHKGRDDFLRKLIHFQSR